MVDDFEEFWSAYPRRVGKAAARREWEKAVRTVAASVIIEAAKRYALSCRGREIRYVAHPRTWLHQRRFEDDCLPDSHIIDSHIIEDGPQVAPTSANEIVKRMAACGMDSVVAGRFFGNAIIDHDNKKILVDGAFAASYINCHYEHLVRRSYPDYEVRVRDR